MSKFGDELFRRLQRINAGLETDLPVCKVCGAQIITGLGLQQEEDTPPEYCWRCNPDRPRVKPSALDRLVCVPSAYRTLVELEILHDISPCGDVEFLMGDDLFAARKAFDVVERNSHLQPFAQMGTGDLWCWTAFRAGPSSEPEIILIEDSMKRVVVYAPNFQTFLYRNALEDASGQYQIDPDDLLPRILGMGKVLRKVGANALADDLESLGRRPVKDYTPSDIRPPGLKLLGRLAKEEVDDRVERFLGCAFLQQEHSYDFLRSA